MSWATDDEVYERIIRGKIKDTGYNLKISEQKYRQDKAAHDTALRELEDCLRNREDQKFANFMKVVVK